MSLRHSAIARIANEVCTPRSGHRKVVLIFGDAIKNNTFHGCRGHRMGPARAVYDYIVANKMAVVAWGDEHRTSKLGVDGHVARHPIERQPHRLKRKRCRLKEHGIDIEGCRCYCSHEGCTEKRTYAHQCARHHKLNPKTVSGVVLTNNGQALNRDVSGAISIGCCFLASCLGIDLHRWGHHTVIDDTPAIGWKALFEAAGMMCPFILKSYSRTSGGTSSRRAPSLPLPGALPAAPALAAETAVAAAAHAHCGETLPEAATAAAAAAAAETAVAAAAHARCGESHAPLTTTTRSTTRSSRASTTSTSSADAALSASPRNAPRRRLRLPNLKMPIKTAAAAAAAAVIIAAADTPPAKKRRSIRLAKKCSTSASALAKSEDHHDRAEPAASNAQISSKLYPPR